MLFGIVGFLGSGKGTVADIFVEEYGFVKDAFANPLKDATAAIFGWDRALLEGDTNESREFREKIDPFWSVNLGKIHFTPRLALQLMGTEAGRDVFGEQLWVAALARRYTLLPGRKNMVVADVRFPNEIRAIEDLGGHVVRVQRGPEPDYYNDAYSQNTNALFGEDAMANRWPDVHPSEWAWIGRVQNGYHIENDRGLDELRAAVHQMVDYYRSQVV